MFQQLTSSSFERIQKAGKDMLILKDFPNNKVLVIFTGNGCEYCVKFIELIKEIAPQFENDILICILNLSNHPIVHEKSKNTATEITHVPYLILYIYNRPYIIYKGDYTHSDIINFLQTSLSEFDQSIRRVADKPRVDATRAASVHSTLQRSEDEAGGGRALDYYSNGGGGGESTGLPQRQQQQQQQQLYKSYSGDGGGGMRTNIGDTSEKVYVIQKPFLTMREAYS